MSSRDAVMSQHHGLHHPKCWKVKDLKNPVRVSVIPSNYQAVWGRFDAELPTGGQQYASVVGCCHKHYRVVEVRRWEWADDG